VLWLLAFSLAAFTGAVIVGGRWLQSLHSQGWPVPLAGAVVAVTGLFWFIWLHRERSSKRWNAVLDAYAEQEIARDRRRKTTPLAVQFDGRNNQGRDRPYRSGKSSKTNIPAFHRDEAPLGALRNTSSNLKERLAAELTDVAYPMALRQGVQGFSVDVELDIWRAIYGTLQEMPDPFLIKASETLRLWEAALARLTDAAYKVALLRGFRGTFVDFELRLWDAFHEELPSAF
jgi:hypothetical protein